MSEARFDRIAKEFAAGRVSRRSALTRAGLGLGMAAGAMPLLASAQESTPAATPVIGEERAREFLFVQSFASGSLTPKAGEEGVYVLELEQGGGQTIYFSDRPERIVGMVPMQQFLDGLGFTPESPPNAALVAETEQGGEEIIVVELLDPRYDAESGTLTYDVRILADVSQVDMMFEQAPAADDHPGATFGASHLFIDDCPKYPATCYHGDTAIDYGCQAFCWSSGFNACEPCQTILDQCCHDQPSGQCDVVYQVQACS